MEARSDELKGRVALVTGGGRRLGQAIALELAAAGADIVVHYHRSDVGADETSQRARSWGRRAWTIPADLRSPAEIERLVETVTGRVGHLDFLVNSAADYERAPLAELTAERWDAMLDLNLRAPYLLTRAFRPLLERSTAAAVVNVADVAGLAPWSNHLHYAVSKAGLVAMTRCLAVELAPGIRVNAVAPGTIIPAPGQDPADLVAIRARTPLGRLASPVDVGRAVVFLAGGPASITGQVLAVDGGRSVFSAG